jgi:hypothetical protein
LTFVSLFCFIFFFLFLFVCYLPMLTGNIHSIAFIGMLLVN